MLEEGSQRSQESLTDTSKEQILPASLIEGLSGDQLGSIEDVGSAIYQSDELFGPGLREEWSRLASDQTDEEAAFREAVALYVTSPLDLYLQSPEVYEYLREQVFYGREYGDQSVMEQIREGVASLDSVEGLRPDVWEGLKPDERAEALKEAERRLAEVEGRPAIDVVFDIEEPPGLQGYFRPDEGVLHLRRDMLDAKGPENALDTVAHEGRHAFQNYAIAHPGFLENPDREAAWRANMPPDGLYFSPESFGYEVYTDQPVEKDAWAFGRAIRAGVYGGTQD